MKSILKIFIMGLLLVESGLVKAQIEDQLSIGPRLGVNFSNVSNVDNSKSLTGLVLGLTSTYSFAEVSGLTIDLLYSVEGYEIFDTDYKFSYLQIPIYYDLFFGNLGEPFRPKVYIGIVPGFLLNAKSNDVELDKDLYNGFQFAFGGGLGFNYRVANRIWLNADLRASVGLTDLRSDLPSGSDKVALRTFQPSIGLAYGLSKL